MASRRLHFRAERSEALTQRDTPSPCGVSAVAQTWTNSATWNVTQSRNAGSRSWLRGCAAWNESWHMGGRGWKAATSWQGLLLHKELVNAIHYFLNLKKWLVSNCLPIKQLETSHFFQPYYVLSNTFDIFTIFAIKNVKLQLCHGLILGKIKLGGSKLRKN